jgi:hypothetical protein
MLDPAVDAATIRTLTPGCFAVDLAPMVASQAQGSVRGDRAPGVAHEKHMADIKEALDDEFGY